MAANAEAGAGAANGDVARTAVTTASAARAQSPTPASTVAGTVVSAVSSNAVSSNAVSSAAVSSTAVSSTAVSSTAVSSTATNGTDGDPADSPPAIADGVIAPGASPTPAPAAKPTTEPAALSAKPSRRQRIWRGVARGIALLAIAITVMMIALAIGMRSNDAAIDDHFGSATATVLSVSPLRTGIEFVDATGATIRPEGGVLYPGLLSLGQQFVVEYSTQDPQIARVAGRTASVGTIMIVLALAGTYLVAAPLIWWCRRRSRLPLLPFHRDREPVGPVPAGMDRAS